MCLGHIEHQLTKKWGRVLFVSYSFPEIQIIPQTRGFLGQRGWGKTCDKCISNPASVTERLKATSSHVCMFKC